MNEIKMNTLVPNVIERTGNGERSYDLFSRLLKGLFWDQVGS